MQEHCCKVCDWQGETKTTFCPSCGFDEIEEVLDFSEGPELLDENRPCDQ